MTERGILFSGAMVRGLLANRKFVTRRLSPIWDKVKAGDRLWVRETWAVHDGYVIYRADLHDWAHLDGVRWSPSIHMHRTSSRILLEVEEDTRQERLQDITEEDAIAEGAEELCDHCGQRPEHEVHWACEADYEPEVSRRVGFMRLWQSLHTKPGERWEDNPIVRRVGRFHRLESDAGRAAA